MYRLLHCLRHVAFVALFLFPTLAWTSEPMRLQPHPEALEIQNLDKNVVTSFMIEVADTDSKRSAGLMYRTDLPLDRGMLFVWNEAGHRYFWMENTPTPLDIVFANGRGIIVHIAENTTPFSRATIPSNKRAQYALEIHAGTAARIGIVAGMRMAHPIIDGP